MLGRGASWLSACLSLLLSAAAACAEIPPIVLDPANESAPVVGHLGYLRDRTGEAKVEAIADARASGDFKPVTAWPPTFGFAPGAHWFHLRIENREHPASDWLLSIRYALLDHADLYIRHDDGTMTMSRSGDRVDFAERALAHRHFNYRVPLARGESADLYLRVASQSSVQVPLELHTESAFLAKAPSEHLALGLYYGVILGLFLYNLVLFFTTRDSAFFYYVVYAGTFGLVQFCLNGLAFQYLWPTAPDWANDAVLVSIALAMMAMLAFTRAFLDLRRRWRHADTAMLTLIAIFGGLLVMIPVFGYRNTIELETGMVFVVAALIIVSAVKTLRDGYRPARNYLIAWSMLVLGIVVYASVSFGLLPKMFATEYGMQIGSAAEMILLSFALADRINTLRNENERLQRESNEQLEHRVAERTRELDVAMGKLQSVNRMLQEFSLRDGLTGTHNRRYFDQALTEHWARAKQTGLPMSLVMVDIDHFKRINDEHGHLMGDDCLRIVGGCLQGQLRNTEERVVRYGGEEFFVILPETDAATALERAEAIRRAVATLDVRAECTSLTVTVSVGVATFRPDAPFDHTDLLRITDRALYDAKRSGRNRVVVGVA